MNKEAAKAALARLPAPVTDPVPAAVYKIEKRKSTGTKELKVIGDSLELIHKMLTDFCETIMRTDRKESEIAGRLEELMEAVESANSPEDWYDIKETILERLDERVFEESTFTEKSGKGAMRMTTSTKITHVAKLTAAAAKVASTKQKMSSGEYTPTAVVVERGNRTIDEVRKLLVDVLGMAEAGAVMSSFMEKIVSIWDVK